MNKQSALEQISSRAILKATKKTVQVSKAFQVSSSHQFLTEKSLKTVTTRRGKLKSAVKIFPNMATVRGQLWFGMWLPWQHWLLGVQ